MDINSGKRNVFVSALNRWASPRIWGFMLAGALLAGSSITPAQTLVFDRGLPTANLNNAAGTNRSNVLWSDIETSPENPWLPGDDFSLPGLGAYTITTIRVWSTNSTGLSLRGRAGAAPVALVSNVYTATPVTYANSQGYEKAAGGFLQLYQLDFSVNIPLNGGVTYQFFLNGPFTAAGGNDFAGPLLHSSTAALSGSTQQGSDNIFLFVDNAGVVRTWNSQTGAGTYCDPPCVGGSNPTDGNVQVFAIAPAPPAELAVPAMSGLGLAGMALLLAVAGLLAARARRRS